MCSDPSALLWHALGRDFTDSGPPVGCMAGRIDDLLLLLLALRACTGGWDPPSLPVAGSHIGPLFGTESDTDNEIDTEGRGLLPSSSSPSLRRSRLTDTSEIPRVPVPSCPTFPRE